MIKSLDKDLFKKDKAGALVTEGGTMDLKGIDLKPSFFLQFLLGSTGFSSIAFKPLLNLIFP